LCIIHKTDHGTDGREGNGVLTARALKEVVVVVAENVVRSLVAFGMFAVCGSFSLPALAQASGAALSGTVSTLGQKYVPPFPRDGAKQIKETEGFVIWEVTWEKGKSTGLHELELDQVSVILTEGAVRASRPDGTWSMEQKRFGSVRLESKGTVVSEEGVSDEPSRAIVFQLKDTVPPKRPMTEGVPGQFPRLGAAKLFETDRITVWDYTWKVGVLGTRHLHYNQSAAVFLEGGTIRSISEGEPARSTSRQAGDITYQPALKAPHQEQAVEGSPRAIFIQFK
jgi:hypothetical protein